MFFAPILPPSPPAPATSIVVRQPLPAAPTLAPPPVLAQVVSIPESYKFGACQALHRLAWDLHYSFEGECTPYNRVQPMPLRFGTPAPASAWLDVLARQLPPGTRVVVNVDAHTLAVTPN